MDSYFDTGETVIIDPNDTTVYWYGGDNSSYKKSVAKSTDMGVSWTHHDLSTTTGSCEDIAIKPGNSDIMYAAGPPLFHKTTDGGITWDTLTNDITGVIHAVIIDHRNNNVVYAGGDDGVFKSMNEGQTWNNKGLADVTVLFMDPDDNDIIFAGTQNGLYKTSDGGETWNDENGGLEDLRVTSFSMVPDAYWFVGTAGSGMYRWEIVVGDDEAAYQQENTSFSVLPNPMSNQTTITYSVSKKTEVSLKLYDVQGRLVNTLSDRIQPPGTYSAHWDGVDTYGNPVPAGIYFFRLLQNGKTYVQKIAVLSR